MVYRQRIYKYILLFALILSNIHLSAQDNESLFKYKNKIAPPILNKSQKSTTSDYRILIKKTSVSESWIEKNLSGIAYQKTEYEQIIILQNISQEDLVRIAENDTVIYIDVANRKAQEERILDSLNLSVNFINKLHKEFPEVKGEKLVISIKERPFDTLDIDLHNRILFKSKIIDDVSSHATSMATIAAGAGNSGRNGLGVAPEAFIVSASYDNLTPEKNQNLINEGVTVQNHSYGIGEIENYYGLESQLYDQQTFEIPYLLHVFSSGNIGNKAPASGTYSGIEGYANLTGQFKTSKNTLCVGNVDKFNEEGYFSCKGPTADGRIKPEIVAFGAGGTSDAAALVSGVAILIQNAYFNIFDQLPPSELLKCVLINSARDIGIKGPDYATGFGSINAFGALKTVIDTHFFVGSIHSNDEANYSIVVPPNTDVLKATLVWKDPAIFPGTYKSLVNDLNLQLIHNETSTNYLPWVLSSNPNLDSLKSKAIRRKDTLNNVEQITLDTPAEGTYSLIIQTEKLINEQSFCLSYSIKSRQSEWIFPLSNNKIIAGEEIFLRWNWTDNSQKGIIEYKKTNSSNWVVVQNDVNLTKGYLKWSSPNINSKVQLRIKTADVELISDTIILSATIYPEVGYNCEEEVMLYWPEIKSAKSYNLWFLDDKVLEKMMNINDTLLTIQKNLESTKYYAVSAVFHDFEGLRGFSVNYDNQNIDCYIKTFYPLANVTTDQAKLQLELASTFELKSVTLQRMEGTIVNDIVTISPIGNTSLILEDHQPKENNNIYRVCLEKFNGKVMYSHEETVFFNNTKEIFIFPNPVIVPGFLNIINSDESSEINLYNLSGKLIKKYENIVGEIKSVDISQIESGIYIIESINNSGHRLRSKVVIIR